MLHSGEASQSRLGPTPGCLVLPRDGLSGCVLIILTLRSMSGGKEKDGWLDSLPIISSPRYSGKIMSLLRSAAPLRRTVVQSVRPSVMSARGYADKPTGEFSEQHQRGNPKGFAAKEQVRCEKERSWRWSDAYGNSFFSLIGPREPVRAAARG